MPSYGNVGGDSGIRSYDIDPAGDWITVTFNSGDTYEYTTASVGARNLKVMITFAQAGAGLHSFINRKVKQNYSRKL